MLMGMTERHTTDELDAWMPLSTAYTRLLKNVFPTTLISAAPTAESSDAKEKREEDKPGELTRGNNSEREDKNRRVYVEQRTREIEKFERQARGEGQRRAVTIFRNLRAKSRGVD